MAGRLIKGGTPQICIAGQLPALWPPPDYRECPASFNQTNTCIRKTKDAAESNSPARACHKTHCLGLEASSDA